ILSQEQETVLQQILNLSNTGRKPVLLYGITGSGKTYVYIELVKKIIETGKNVIVLVPEISLTPQTIKRFKNSINCEIGVIHSRMSDGERRDTIENILCGKIRIVIGVRSAILAPLDNIGLIIVDEEHDGSYKQSDPEPRYNSRDVAVMRGKLQNALVLLGSATPSFESYNNALNKKYTLINLTQRYGKAMLPKVQIVDMTQEYKRKNYTFISQHLKHKIHETLANKKQIILFINRRGFSVCLICMDCGYVYECTNCSVKLIYHKSSYTLKCHQCGYSITVPEKCISCGGEQIKYKGTGIQKVEEYLKVLFKEVRIIRMDQDTMKKKGSHISLYEAFLKGKADILLGTQMIAKGFNFPDVRLVGVLQADIGLHFPDFRASEKTFQLLTQVAGRAGRKDDLGEVIIQTYSPHEPGVQFAKTHDFLSFYQEETKSRIHLGYPPFSRLARILIQGEQEMEVSSYMERVAQFLIQKYGNIFTFLGPSPAVITKVKNLYRYSLLIKSKYSKQLEYALATIKIKFKKLPGKMKLIIDVDPYNML
ncbi:MAG: primosomal protein N', partial [Chitinispirillia bacterium]